MELQEALVTIDLLRGQAAALEQQVRERDDALAQAHRTIELQCFQIARLRDALYGDKSERFVDELLSEHATTGSDATSADGTDNDAKGTRGSDDVPKTTAPQDDLHDDEREDDGEGDDAAANDNGEPRWPRKRGGPDKESLLGRPKRRRHLEVDPARVTEKHEHVFPDRRTCRCCGEPLVSIGEDLHARIEREPVRFRRVVTHRHRMACARCRQGGVTVAPLQDPPAFGAGMVGASFAVDIVLQHYNHHLPFHRLASIYRDEGVSIDRATLSRIGGRVADALAPIVAVMKKELLGSDGVLGLDGTPIKILAQPHCARRETYVYHGGGHVVFEVLARKDAPTVLAGFEQFRGVGVGDAAKVHLGSVAKAKGFRVGLCHAHARRRFFKAREVDRARSAHVLLFYRQLARLERSWSDLSPADRQREREMVLVPRFDALKVWAQAQRGEVHEQSPMRKALDYLLTHWEGLTLFLRDGRLPWHNNESERLLRHIAVGRHAWMFRGSFKGARRAAVLWSLLRSCAVQRLDPRAYLVDTLAALEDTPHAALHTLTPKAYAARQRAALAVA